MHTAKPSERRPRMWDWSEMAEGCYCPRFQTPQASCHGSTFALDRFTFALDESTGATCSYKASPSLFLSLLILVCQCLSGRQGVDPFSSFVCSASLSGGKDISSRGTGKSRRHVLCRHNWDGGRTLLHLQSHTFCDSIRLKLIFSDCLVFSQQSSHLRRIRVQHRHVVPLLSGGSSSQREWQALTSCKKDLVFTSPPANSGAAGEISIERSFIPSPYLETDILAQAWL